MRFITFILLSILLFQNTSYSQLDPNARDLRILANWFEGEFDNDEQLWYEGRMKVPEEDRHDRLHATHKRIDAGEIGEFVFYVEEYMSDDPDSIIRQRVVSFESVPDSAFIKMKLYFLKDAKRFILANQREDTYANITMEDLFGLDGCNLVFRRQGEQYHGSMRHKACQFGNGEKLRYSQHDMIISKTNYWRVDRTFLVKDDSFYSGHSTADPHIMRKANLYSCDVSFYEKAYYMPSEKDKKYQNVIIHDQGGSKLFYNPIEDKNYMLQLRSKEYPFYESGSDFFMMRLKEEGALASNLIVTATPGTKNISFNMGTASASCEMIKKE